MLASVFQYIVPFAFLAGEFISFSRRRRQSAAHHIIMTKPKILPPPTGHASWLDYAVDTMDTRSIEIEYLFENDSTAPTREAMRDSVRAELEALRRAVTTVRHETDDAGAGVEAMRDLMQNAEPMDDVDIRELIEDGRAKR